MYPVDVGFEPPHVRVSQKIWPLRYRYVTILDEWHTRESNPRPYRLQDSIIMYSNILLPYLPTVVLEALSTSLTKVLFQTSLPTDYDYFLILNIRCLLDFSRLTLRVPFGSYSIAFVYLISSCNFRLLARIERDYQIIDCTLRVLLYCLCILNFELQLPVTRTYRKRLSDYRYE
jgi:hypothetical protein